MKNPRLTCCALTICAAVAMFAGCGTLPTSPPNGHDDAQPAAGALGRATTSAYAVRRPLIFEADEYEDAVNVYRAYRISKHEAPIAQIPTGGGPYGLAMDTAGTLYVAQYYAWTVSEYAKGSTTATTVIADGLQNPYGVAVDRHGTLFVSNNPGWISVYPYGSTNPSATITGEGLQHPAGLAVDEAGNLFIADLGAAKVFEVPAGTETVIQLQLADLVHPIGIAINQQSGEMWLTDGTQVNVYSAGSQYPSHVITGFANAYAISIQNNGSAKGAATLADSNADRVYAFKPGQYTPYAWFDKGMEQPTGVLIVKP